MVKIKDIAKKANVSLSAVSMAINGKKGLSIETREKILKIAHELNYQQSSAREIRGVLRFLKIALHGETINEAHNLFISGYIDGLIEQARKCSYALEVVGYDKKSVEEIVRTQNNGVLADGLVILGTEFEQGDFTPLRRLLVPFVIIDNVNDFLPFDFINMNNRGAIYNILHHFKRAGIEDIGLVYSDAHTPNFRKREQAFHELVSVIGLRSAPENLVCVSPNARSAYEAMLNHIRAQEKIAQGYFCINDIVAYGCIRALHECGFRVPDDVSVIGFDDLPVSAVMEPALTTVKVGNKKLGAAAVDLLVSKIDEGRNNNHTSVLLSGELVKRKSVRHSFPKPL
ncbi:LacI family transcriptional regulator [Salmonella enterica]|nr:LacI family transcriptional regulator [Salmonella enterica]EDB9445759.1 LacI family transcriptional regulator [Salmonella enterica subsp. enterica serovar Enteritidis]EBI5032901.1 LacI family transcriptional regulator [Salmonella enterica]EBN2823437.1 LacI family transcriptional regulator [Salmonella enterica]ECU1627109.1 LacI family transcriptional regulator [Salmonella enterica]